ncbi:hypothetical protein P879_11582 [Paragonimus westermani]|uniref:Uncharacterized protein n=1 Tax=Paragonimus westermani TaxID=34504 RepID=A0A8T0DCE3_9TREM|nr:hypothetical protein P879_11582 [Paragonimus westermani]
MSLRKTSYMLLLAFFKCIDGNLSLVYKQRCGIQGQTGWDFVTQLNSGVSLSYPRCLLPSTGSLHLALNGLCKPLLTTGQLLLNPSENTEMAAIYVACGSSVSVVLADLKNTSSNTVSYQTTVRQ